MRNLFNMFFSVRRAKEYKGLTDFLVENPAFRHLALKFHKSTGDAVNNLEKYLDKEILGQEQKKPQDPLRVNTAARN